MIATYSEFPTERFQFLKTIGNGTYGEVFLAKNTETDTPVAVKRCKISLKKDGIPSVFLREI
jgi:serine/threonine protein kinase